MLFTKPGSRWIWSEGMIGNDYPRPYRGRGKENALWIPGRFLYILGRFAFSLCCGLNCLPSQFVCWSPISWYLRMWLYLKIRHVLNSSIDFFFVRQNFLFWFCELYPSFLYVVLHFENLWIYRGSMKDYPMFPFGIFYALIFCPFKFWSVCN